MFDIFGSRDPQKALIKAKEYIKQYDTKVLAEKLAQIILSEVS